MASSAKFPKRIRPRKRRFIGSPYPLVQEHLEWLRGAGFSEATIYCKQVVIHSFLRRALFAGTPLPELRESHLDRFLPDKTDPGAIQWRRFVVLEFLEHIHQGDAYRWRCRPAAPPPPPGSLFRCYIDHLLEERGLTAQSVHIYSPFVLAAIDGLGQISGSLSPGDWDAGSVNAYLLDRARNHSAEYARLLATTLRSLLHFLFGRGMTPVDLSLTVAPVRKWRLASIPTYLSPEDVEKVLAIPDLTSPVGCRDHAILLLLARLGMRAGEVAAMELEDIHWRTGEILVRGKGRQLDPLPLLPEVGDSLARYLQQGRKDCRSRKVFLRSYAPREGFTGPSAIVCIVRNALAKAGIVRTGRGASHLFRHSLATRMIRHGASIQEISEVLRHRSGNTTGIYAKVAFESLRGVAQPWPLPGGAR